jgi:hypothetical protein
MKKKPNQAPEPTAPSGRGSSLTFGRNGNMRFALVLLFATPSGCVSASSSKEARVQALLGKGLYREAIVEIERDAKSADDRFALGLLYAFRELEERGEAADFSRAMSLIRSAAPEVEVARHLVSDYDQRGPQVFWIFPWAHMIGPFSERPSPRPVKEPNQPLEPTRAFGPSGSS